MKNKLNRIWLLTLVIFASTACWAQMPTQTLSVSGLKESVTVRRDARGIPYIEAKSDADLAFAQGYVTAQDRLWQMDLYRRVARGETAEIFGKATFEEDKRWRKFGFARIAEDTLQILAPEVRASLEDYARGVNAYIAALDAKSLPAEFQILQYKPRQWQAADSIVIGKIFADALSTTWQNDLLRAALKQNLSKEKYADLTNLVTPFDVVLFGKDSATERTENTEKSDLRKLSVDSVAKIADREIAVRKSSLERIGFYAEDLAASNNFVVSGKRTLDGKPLLENDPHLSPNAPGIWYMVNLSSPNLHTAGVTAAGIPGIILGHNDSIAWGATNVGPDVQDLYIETFDANGKYKTPNGMESPTIRKEEIKVRKNPLSPETETQTLDVTETRDGVIIAEEGGKKYALKWTARDPKNNEVEAFYYMNRAKDWDDFKAALKRYGGATQNFVYADAKGNIGWQPAGKIPIRQTGDGALPYDGATNGGDWTGFI
ncbi:MAG: penicillin acylase family protein, partial [Pyrinomonadaceae bacterium]